MKDQFSNSNRPITSIPINLIGLFSSLATLYLISVFGGHLNTVDAQILCLSALVIPIALLELLFLKTHRRRSTGLDFSRNNKGWLGRTFLKIIGFYCTLAIIALAYWFLPEYSGSFYEKYYDFLLRCFPYLVIAAPFYIAVVDRIMIEPKDVMWQMGRVFFGEWSKLKSPAMSQYWLGWLVKAFFLPLMFVYMGDNLSSLRLSSYDDIFSSFTAFYDFCFLFLYYIDLLFVLVGYIFTLRVLDSHIRSTDPSLLGWAVAISCYQPFWSFWSSYYIQYEDKTAWGFWFENFPLIYGVWGTLILLMLFVYVWASITFGLRFSNLTHRGILTHGPYRYVKHPAYLAKNISWWLIALPFLSVVSWQDGLKHSLMLLALNGIYYLRAITEERHLGKDTAYRIYQEQISRHGLFAKIWSNKLLK